MRENKEKQYFIAKVLGEPNGYLVDLGGHKFNYGKKIIIKTAEGLHFAYINSFLFTDLPKEHNKSERASLIRYASEEDEKLNMTQEEESKILRKRVANLVQELNLNMNITHLILDLNSENLLIYYTASERIDFRELLRRLRQEWRYKNTLRHITPKQRQHAFIADPRIPKS